MRSIDLKFGLSTRKHITRNAIERNPQRRWRKQSARQQCWAYYRWTYSLGRGLQCLIWIIKAMLFGIASGETSSMIRRNIVQRLCWPLILIVWTLAFIMMVLLWKVKQLSWVCPVVHKWKVYIRIPDRLAKATWKKGCHSTWQLVASKTQETIELVLQTSTGMCFKTYQMWLGCWGNVDMG